MDHLTAALLIPIAVIVMGGLSQIVRDLTRVRRHPDMNSLEPRMESLEHELRAVRRDLSETQERLDFAERLLAQSRERKQLGATE
jgi:hypothetical protein